MSPPESADAADPPPPPASRVEEYVAMALVSAAVLLFETLITRVLSVTIHYHFAFLAISLAMLGIGAPGVWFSIRAPGPSALRTALFLSAIAIPAGVVAIVKLGALWRSSTTLVIVALLGPLLALGSAVCILLVRAKGKGVARMYAADLLGASLGAVAIIPLLQGIPTPPLIASLAMLPLLAATLLAAGDRRTIAGVVLLATILVALIAWGRPFRLHYTKRYTENVAPIYERWTPTARVTVFSEEVTAPSDTTSALAPGVFGWGMGSRFVPPKREALWLDQDGSAGTAIVRWSRGDSVPQFLYFDVTSVAYQLDRPLDRVAIIGGGGGRDILTAFGAGARAIDAIELNPYIAAAVRENFAEYSGDPYDLPGVTAIIGEGRSVLTGRDARYDVIQISLIDTFAATAAGAYALSENGLYTVEAFRSYFQRLTTTGVLSVSRWTGGAGRLEAPRLVLLAQEALSEEGITEPRAHMIVMQAGIIANLLLFRSPIDAALLAKADDLATLRGFVRVWPPTSEPTQSAVALALVAGPEPFAEKGFDVTPPTDDRPFFFQTTDLLSPPPPEVREKLGRIDPALLLRKIVLVLAAITGALFFLPIAMRRRWPTSTRLGRGTAYFAAIGVAFMLVEIPLVLRVTLYLGHPSRGAAVVLGALLLGAGVGSAMIARASQKATVAFLAALPFVVIAATLGLGPMMAATLAWGVAARVVLAITALLPLGFVMGTAFPAGMIRFDDIDRSWLWAVNGASSVLASALAIAFSIIAGLTITMVVGALGYLAVVLVWLRSQATSPPGETTAATGASGEAPSFTPTLSPPHRPAR